MRNILFSNTGIQFVYFDLAVPLDLERIGEYRWNYCRCQRGATVEDYPYIQWRVGDHRDRLYLAVDTTIGIHDDDYGFFKIQKDYSGDFSVSLAGLLGTDGTPLPLPEPMELIIRAAESQGGGPINVDLVVDFGNSRTGALLVEFHGTDPQMTPMPLLNRFHLETFEERGPAVLMASSPWFSSKTHWSLPPYLEPLTVYLKEHEEIKKTGLFGGKEVREYSIPVVPDLFKEYSMVRLGREADDLLMSIQDAGNRTGVSSPKRYLWADNASWLGGSFWWMIDQYGLYDQETGRTTLKGPLLRYIAENDSDEPTESAESAPFQPQYAPRVMMIAALYEILCQAFTAVNSSWYRRRCGNDSRTRQIQSLTLTYPSGMIEEERDRFKKQAQKAIDIFVKTLGRRQTLEPRLRLSIDEASAVQLTYLWSEIQKVGKMPKLLFNTMGRHRSKDIEQTGEKPDSVQNAKTVPSRRRFGKPDVASAEEAFKPSYVCPEFRIACIDIGGGTSDLMIARYHCEGGQGGDRISGETLHRDGLSVAGDFLVKRLLECLIVPWLSDATNMDPVAVQKLFGPDTNLNREFAGLRIRWINHLFVPLAQQYLVHAGADDSETEISHLDPEIVDPKVVESLQKKIDELYGPGYCSVSQPLGLFYRREDFEEIVKEVFDSILFDYCRSIVEYDADVVLLAGQLSKLEAVRKIIESYLPLPTSRIIPMYGRYVGNWYPYQSAENMSPGIIIDPKSPVVVGAAIDLAAQGLLDLFKFQMKDKVAGQSYFWGTLTDNRIVKERILFQPRENDVEGADRFSFPLLGQRLLIGRKRRENDDAQATPIYQIRLDGGPSTHFDFDLRVTLERKIVPSKENRPPEEKLELVEVEGIVNGEPAVIGRNVLFQWHTLSDENFYLDTGGLDSIEL